MGAVSCGAVLTAAERSPAGEQRIPFASPAGVGPHRAKKSGQTRGVWGNGSPLGAAAKAILPGRRMVSDRAALTVHEGSPAVVRRIPFAGLGWTEGLPARGWNRVGEGGSCALGDRLVKKEGGLTHAGADPHPCALTKLRYQRGPRLVRLVMLVGAGGGGSA